jgi:hypothetical protein
MVVRSGVPQGLCRPVQFVLTLRWADALLSMRKHLAFLLAVIMTTITTGTTYAWSNHFLFYRPALEAMPEISGAAKVKIESLEDFLLKEKDGLISLLAQIEADAKITYAKSAPLPDALAFKGGDAATIRENFLRALRVNPATPLGYFIQELPDHALTGPRSNSNTVSMFGDKDILNRYAMSDIRKGTMVAPIDVLATAGDEPDFGLDINLFTDNQQEFSKNYGFGKQSFGDPKLYYGSQAPFHIGYYHEAGIVFLAAGFLKRTYPRYRVHQFTSLARYAFKTGHPYWGYRFLGWGLHYVGDLTQPYHTRVLPNYGALSMIWINIKSMLGFGQAKIDAIERISSRHTAIEQYHFSVLQGAYREKKLDHPFITSVKMAGKDATYPKFDDTYLVDILAKESYDISDRIDTLIEDSNLLKGFSDGNALPEANKKSLAELDSAIVQHMQSVGAHVRNYVRSGLN